MGGGMGHLCCWGDVWAYIILCCIISHFIRMHSITFLTMVVVVMLIVLAIVLVRLLV